MKENKTDIDFMNRVLIIAENGGTFVSPNPKVGALIVKNDEIISEGWHKEYGGSHAEVEAVKSASIEDFSECTMYVNLEPCSHYGKTPPCADMIVAKKFKRVVIAMQDPNPLVAGNGIEKLRRGNVEVTMGVLENEAKYLNRFFIKHISTGIPYVILKVAQSIDGKIALNNYSSKWITGEKSRNEVHKMRSNVSAVLVGKNTIIYDNPRLDVRGIEGNNPLRVILDTNLSLDDNYEVFSDNSNNNTIVCCSISASKKSGRTNDNRRILPVTTNYKGNLHIPNLLFELGKLNISSVLVEGGASIFSSFIESNLVDELHIFTAPKIIGKGIGSFNNIEIDSLDFAHLFRLHEIEKCGEDIHCIYKKK